MPGTSLHRVVLSTGSVVRAIRSLAAVRMSGVLLTPVLLTAVLLVAGMVTTSAAPAQAAERTVTVTAEGVQPQVLTASPGDTVRFVVEDDTFAYRAQSTGGNWRFDSGPVELLSGTYEVPSPLEAAGTYTYRVAQDPPFSGTVLVTDDGAAAGPSPPGSATDGAAVPGAGAPTGTAGPSPSAAGSSSATAVPPGAAPPSLSQPASSRRLGLPAALALLLVAGTASLLLRALLAEPVLSDPGARLRADGGGRPRW